MHYQQATDYLHSLINYETTPTGMAMRRYVNLARMNSALAALGDPHHGLRVAHIAGTKGKGSTAAMLARIVRAGGRRVGLYTSPHLVSLRERIRVDDAWISEDDFAAGLTTIRPVAEAMRATPDGPPTYFETLTLLAFLHFARAGVEVAVLETGMGGRLDATNCCLPLVTGITTLALDHTAELGDTLALIAAEKAGILKPGVPVVCAPHAAEAAAVMARTAAEHRCPRYTVGAEIIVTPGATDATAQTFTITGRHGTYALTCPLLGAHQQLNAAVAVGMAEVLHDAGEPLTPAAIRNGIAQVCWPGRLQILQHAPLLLLDGAHDPAAMAALLDALAALAPHRPRRLVLGIMADKDWRTMLAQAASCATELILTAPHSPRAVPPATLADAARTLGVPYTVYPDTPTALRTALAHAAPDDCVLVTGSLYLVGEALAWWEARTAQPCVITN